MGSAVMLQAQNIRMDFPHFAGKTYDFIIFQGTEAKIVFQGTIPQSGKFTLSIPKEYAPYTGMSRWLITGTKEGGGLDMLIPGKDFSVICTEPQPNNENIIYKENNEIPELTALDKKQQSIFAKYDAMLQSTRAFPKQDKNYPIFEKEYQNQLKSYKNFQQELIYKNTYATKFIAIVNITRGIGTEIYTSEKENAQNVSDYITTKLDWQTLYTSGHWNGVISSWVAIHTQIFNDPVNFTATFKEVSEKIKDPKQYSDFAKVVASAINQNGKDNFAAAIAPIVKLSRKISSYDGSLALFVVAAEGTQAPDLTLDTAGNNVLKSTDFTGKEYRKTLLLFYESNCRMCEQLLQEIPAKYEQLKTAGVRIISLSADENETLFKTKAKDFLWKDIYSDYQGFNGTNFKKYGVSGTPTLFLIDSSGKIELRTGSLEDVIKHL